MCGRNIRLLPIRGNIFICSFSRTWHIFIGNTSSISKYVWDVVSQAHALYRSVRNRSIGHLRTQMFVVIAIGI